MLKDAIMKFRDELHQEHQGAVAFEYIIVLVIMSVAVFAAWDVLADQVALKAKDIAVYIQNNGKTNMGNTGTRINPQWQRSGGR